MRKGNFLPRPVEKLMGQCLHPCTRPSRLHQRREPKKRQVGQLRQRTTPNPSATRQVASLSLKTTYKFPRFPPAAASTWLSCYRSYRRLVSTLAFLLLSGGSAHEAGPAPAALHCTGLLARLAARRWHDFNFSEQNQKRSSGQSWRCLATPETSARSRTRSPTADLTMNRCTGWAEPLLPCSSECTPRPLCRHRVPESRLLKMRTREAASLWLNRYRCYRDRSCRNAEDETSKFPLFLFFPGSKMKLLNQPNYWKPIFFFSFIFFLRLKKVCLNAVFKLCKQFLVVSSKTSQRNSHLGQTNLTIQLGHSIAFKSLGSIDLCCQRYSRLKICFIIKAVLKM